jgi:hypothetical protein
MVFVLAVVAEEDDVLWPTVGHDVLNTHSQPDEEEISPNNVGNLLIAKNNVRSGKVLFDFFSGGSVIDGPSIADGVVFWGSGYSHISDTRNRGRQ